MRAARIGFVFQEFRLIPYLNVRENVLAPSLGMRTPAVGERAGELVAAGGTEAVILQGFGATLSAKWHDLVLYLL